MQSDNTCLYLAKFLRNGSLFFRFIFPIVCLFLVPIISQQSASAQSEVTGGFSGYVRDSVTQAPIEGAIVTFTKLSNQVETSTRTNASGSFNKANLTPGDYAVTITKEGYLPENLPSQKLFATRSNSFQPIADVFLKKETIAVTTPDPVQPPVATVTPTFTPTPVLPAPRTGGGAETNVGLTARRDQTFAEETLRTLPLGGTTLTRSFDELALLVPGVAPAPQSLGNGTGPGVGPGVGTSGQFSVNGLRSRANNFTVDGSDNNDEDIGVRRQGFFSLVPQPIESVEEFTIITLLAPAQFGRNLGAQVNAISKSGGNAFRGTVFGFFNSSQLNARNTFDNAAGNTTLPLTARRIFDTRTVDVRLDGRPISVTNSAGDKESFTLFQGGAAIGGPIYRNKLFFFVSGEGQVLNATQERHYAVPTVEQRGLLGTGAQGLFFNTTQGTVAVGFPTNFSGDTVFSLFPFANDPSGVFGVNTYSQNLSADARGRILSGRIDYNFSFGGKSQSFTARYNNTDDQRDLPDVGGALFSSIRPITRTDNFSTFLNSDITNNISNVFRFSFGRTGLNFEELRDTSFLLPIPSNRFNNPGDARFLLNARVLSNFTRPGATVPSTQQQCSGVGTFNNGQCAISGSTFVDYRTAVVNNGQLRTLDITDPLGLGFIGQLNISGFSPVGVDVFNFPQERTNRTFQFADVLNWATNGGHNLAFGTDIRRAFLDSDLPRNSRPLVTFNGGVNLNQNCRDLSTGLILRFCTPLDLASSGAATGFFQSLKLPGTDSRIKLSYYQLNFFAQDEWRARPNLNINYGLRYEYNTTPKEADNKIERTFGLTLPNGQNLPPRFSGLRQFIDGRTSIYESDRNNFAPRIGFAYAPVSSTVIRGGYGIYYDQIIGAVVSQSRNVFPSFLTVNTGGGELACQNGFSLFNPITYLYDPNTCRASMPIVQRGTLNTLNPAFDFLGLLNGLSNEFPSATGISSAGTFGATLPAKNLDTPESHQYFIGVEQELLRNTYLSVGYIGTAGRKLLRFTTPNLGRNFVVGISRFQENRDDDGVRLLVGQAITTGGTFSPFTNPDTPNRPITTFGPVEQFETTGRSQYDSLQIQLRGRFSNSIQYQTSYTLSEVNDDVSDVFDLAGAHALPQNSLAVAGEYGPANFDVRHRFTYSFIYDLPLFRSQNNLVELIFGGWQLAGTGKYHSGQPFTVNSIFDVNLDGNLTDRLDNLRFIQETGDRAQPLRLTTTNIAQLQQMLAPIGRDGSISRNSFRAGSVLELDMSFNKRFFVTERQNLLFRVDVFNFINRANYGIPIRFLEAPGFGRAVDTVTPGRRIQFGLKYIF